MNKKRFVPLILSMTLCLTSVAQVSADVVSDPVAEENMSFAVASQKKPGSCQVFFRNNNGKSSHDYRVLKVNVVKGKTVRLPKVPARKGRVGIGWATVPNSSKAQYKPGAKVTVTSDMKFYAVFKKASYTVNYYDSDGSQGKAFASLKQKVIHGRKITIPSLPGTEGSAGIGWSTQKNSKVVAFYPGQKVKVSKNISLYAVYKQSTTVSFYNNDGSPYRNLYVEKGESFTFPAMLNEKNHTMLGWSTTRGKQTDPEYEVGESLRVDSDRKFYAVVFDRSNEVDYSLSDLPALDTSRYQKVIFVGDSRMERMSILLNKSGPQPFLKNVGFAAKGGKGLDWLQGEGYKKILQEVGSGAGDGKPIAVIFNMGINDLSKMDQYISFYKKIAGELKGKGCRLFFMSLTPINSENLKAVGIAAKKERKEEWVRTFNSNVRFRLCGGSNAVGTYLDAYSYLINNGYGMDSGRNGIESGKDDGLHYTNKTYKRIFKYSIDFLNGVAS